MFTQRYSPAEMDQWHTAACANATPCTSDAPRHHARRTAGAKGQGERNPSRTSQTAATQISGQVSANLGESYKSEYFAPIRLDSRRFALGKFL
ncbi:MAG: hypothetical protein HY741_18805 [Chloroflexi bacterium]|nr:hypothetical protein [Chloroflexota bacterium]